MFTDDCKKHLPRVAPTKDDVETYILKMLLILQTATNDIQHFAKHREFTEFIVQSLEHLFGKAKSTVTL